MHLKRVVVALIAVPLLYLYVVKLSPAYFLILLAVISALAQHEFHAMYRTPRSMSIVGIIGGALLIGAAFFVPASAPEKAMTMAFVVIFMLIASARLFLRKNPVFALRDISPAVVSIIYIPVLLLPLWYLRLDGCEWIFLLCLSVWSADTFAYYIGSSIGKRKLYKEVSPNKTVEGAVGSIGGGIFAAIVFGHYLVRGIGMSKLAWIGAIIGAVTIVGDLVESMFKRDAGIKDSGSLIPGHGGVLDRIDSILFAGPTLYFLKSLI
ncbi:MAG TPA: phosphatidate cytidylyltransferase [Dissulfurispiraceae bacterium]|nr:phosphatidate cytidylyltransferase [Dissulfurispiraceae bacterium]